MCADQPHTTSDKTYSEQSITHQYSDHSNFHWMIKTQCDQVHPAQCERSQPHVNEYLCVMYLIL